MIKLMKTEEVRKIDEKTINGDISIGFKLMYQASEGLASEIIKTLKGDIRKKIAIVCGRGNNGGDGLLSGSLLIKNGYSVDCFIINSDKELKNEALKAYKEFNQSDNLKIIEKIDDLKCLDEYYLIVDALLGTGVKGDPRGFVAEIIEFINSLNKKIIAVDNPSGLNCDTGEPNTHCIRADKTVTMGFAKIGHLFYPSIEYTGKVEVVSLDYNEAMVNKYSDNRNIITFSDIKKLIPERIYNGSKYDHGVSGIIAGSNGMTGAATLAMNSALRSGCGMVYGFIPNSISEIMSIKTTEPVLFSQKSTDHGTLAYDSYSHITKNLSKVNSLLIGPGLSVAEETKKLVRIIVKKIKKTIVLDADGINAFEQHEEDIVTRESELIITPHDGEFRRLFGELPSDPISRISTCKKISKEYKLTLVLKGKPTIVSNGNETYIIDEGDNSLSTAGTGDVLSGIITSLVAQGASNIHAAIAGVYIHGLAGKIAAEKNSSYSVIASDVCESIGKAFKKILV